MKKHFRLFVIFLAFSGLMNIVSAQNVVFPDTNLANRVRETLNLPEGAAIPKAQLATLTRLHAWGLEEAAPEEKIRDLTGLEHAIQLTTVFLNLNQISDVSPLAGLTQLEWLILDSNQISDISPLTELTQLTRLSLWNNQISDISPLTELAQLTRLSLWDNQISDISPLAKLTQLTILDLWGNQISDISPLAELTQLRVLELSDNQISDISPLTELTQLTRLSLWNNQISDVTALAELTKLGWLPLYSNKISDISPLAGLTQLTRLDLRDNQISDISPIAELTQLKELDLRNNQISDISPLTGLINLEHLSLAENPITDRTPFRTLLLKNPSVEIDIDVSDVISPMDFPEDVWMPDPDLRIAVRNALGLAPEDILTLQVLQTLTQLSVSRGIEDLTGLEHATQLIELELTRNLRVSDISPLAGLTQLTILDLRNNEISDISPIAGLTQLKELNLHYNQISDISPIAGLTQLKELDLGSNQISDISPIAELTQLKELDLGYNQISDISPIAQLTELTSLKIRNNPITDMSLLHALLSQNPNVRIDVEIDGIRSVSFSPDSTLLASGGFDGIKLTDVATQETIATLSTNVTTCVSFSPDGTLIASGSLDGTVKLWDVVRQENVATLKGHTAQVTSVAFSPDGALIASGSFDGTVKLWDVVNHENTTMFPTGTVSSVAFSPDGTLLASGGRGSIGGVKLWDVETKENVATLEGHTTLVKSVSFSSDGTMLVSGSSGIIKMWDVGTRENTTTIRVSWSQDGIYDISSVAFSPDGPLLAYANAEYQNSKVILRNVVTQEKLATFEGHTDDILSVAFSPDGSWLASGSFDGTVKFYDVTTFKYTIVKISGDAQQETFGSSLAEPLVVEVRDLANNAVQGIQVTFTVTAGDGMLSEQSTVEHAMTDANGRAEGTFTLGDAVINTIGVSIGERELVSFDAVGFSRYQIAALEGVSASFSPDGTLLAYGTSNGEVKLWDIATKQNIATLEGHTDEIAAVAFLPRGTLLVSVAHDGSLKLWDIATKEDIATLEDLVSGIFSPDGSLLAYGTSNGELRLWDVATKEDIATLEGPKDTFPLLAFSPDGTLLASAEYEFFSSDDSKIKLWNVARRENIATLEVGKTTSVAFSPDGALLIYTESGDKIKLWDIATEENIATFEGDVAFFSPNGTLLASMTWDGAKLWDVATQENITTFDGVFSVAFSPDGTLLASGEGASASFSDDGSGNKIWLLDLVTHESVATLQGHTDVIWSVVFSPDGKLLASTSFDNTIRLWSVTASITFSESEKIAEDVNGDGVVNIQDLVLVASNLGKTGQNVADVNGDEIVDIRDLVKVAGALGNTIAAPSLHPQALAMFTTTDVRNWLTQAHRLVLPDATAQQGIHFLEQLLATLIPKETVLLPNYPNPFNPETWIPYQLAKPTDVTLTIYAVNGQIVRQLSIGYQLAGTYQSKGRAAYWDGRNAFGEPVASGLYFYTFTAGDFTATRKMLIRK